MAKSNTGNKKKPNKIYVDYAASVTPNPSSIHELGILAKEKLEEARRDVAAVLNARREEIIFTSGGTEGNNLAIQGIVYAAHTRGMLPHIITTNIEHPSVLETCKLLEKRKLAQVSVVSVEASGIVNPKKIKNEIKKNTILVSVMYANNEIGTIQPIREVGKIVRHYRKENKLDIFFHTDAVQAVNYLDLDIEKLGVDMLTLSGAKIEGAGRVGVLYKKKSVILENVFGGGDQEGGLRPGTENLSDISKFADALKFAQHIREKEVKHLTILRDYFFEKLKNFDCIVNGDLENRLPNNINVTFPKIPSDLLVIELSAKGIMASSKSACKSSRAEGSYVIKALRPDADSEIGGLRFSFGRDTTKKDVDNIAKALSLILQKLEKWYY
jgi:cysteine desulfurase